MDIKDLLQELDPFIRALADANFECGNWRKDESEDPYLTVQLAADKAECDLRDAVARLFDGSES